GLIRPVRRGSATVSAIPRREIEEIFELRALLEGYAAEKAADCIDEKAIAKLRRLIDELDDHQSAKDVQKLLLKNEEFHRTICSLAGNKTLLGMLEQIWRDIRRLRFNYLITPAGHEQSKREHEALVDALERREKNLIRKIVREHASRTMTGILETSTHTSG